MKVANKGETMGIFLALGGILFNLIIELIAECNVKS